MMNFIVCASGLENAGRAAARLASQRVKGVEFGARWFMEHTAEEARAAGEAFRAEGVALHSIHAPFRGAWDLSHPDEAPRAAMIDAVAELLEKAAAAGAHLVVVHPGNHAEPSQHSDQLVKTIQSLERLAPRAEATGVRLALENMPPGYPGSHGENLLAIVRQIDSPMLGLCLDTGHAHMTGALMEHFQLMKRVLFHIHLHDNDGRRDQHLPPPYGTINWESFYRLYRALALDFPVVLECSPWTEELGEGMGVESDYCRLLEGAGELFDHLEQRIKYEEQQRRVDEAWRLGAVCPHRRDLV